MAVSLLCSRCGGPLVGSPALKFCPRCMGRDAVESDQDSSPIVPRPAAVQEAAIRCFGDYQLLEEIARGGMGIVYKAWQISLKRIVALKMILAEELRGPLMLSRFRAEAEAAARLQHPNIVEIHEVGEHEGRHYFSMDYVAGENLEQVLRCKPLAPARAARYARIIAEAIHYAHGQGIFHRDLKPSNILIDASDEPRITDFGLAKMQAADSRLTLSEQLVGTPQYMAPEQAMPSRGDVGPFSDVYSVGAILYFLLTAQPPFVGVQLADILQQVLSREPVSPRMINPSVPRDLETICLKCLEKDPQRRYATAEALADDLGRFLADKPIQARPVGSVGKLWRWCHRNPIVASLTVLAFTLLVVIAVGASVAGVLLDRERNSALRAKDDAVERLWNAYYAEAKASRWSGRPGRRLEGLEALAAAAAIRPTLELRNEAIACMALTDLRIARQWDLGPSRDTVVAFQALTFDRDLRRYATSDSKGNLSLRRVADNQEIMRLSGPGQPAWLARFSASGRYLAAKYCRPGANHENRMWVWDLASRQAIFKTDYPAVSEGFDFSSDERTLAIGRYDRTISIHDITSGAEIERFAAASELEMTALRLQPNGRKIAVSLYANVIHIRAVPSGRILHTLRPGADARGFAWHPRHERLAIACADGRLRVYQTDTGDLRTTIEGGPGDAYRLAYSGDGNLLASYWSDMTLRLSHSSGGGTLLGVPRATTVGELAFTTDSRLLSHALDGSKVSLFEVYTAPECRTLGTAPPSDEWLLGPVSVNSDSTLLAGPYRDGVRLWSIDQPEQLSYVSDREVLSTQFTPDGSALLVSGDSGLRQWPIVADPATGGKKLGTAPTQISLPPGATPGRIALSRSGQTLAVIFGDSVLVLDLKTGKQMRRFDGFTFISGVSLSPDGRWLACGTWHGSGAKVFDLDSGEAVLSPPDSHDSAVAFSPDRKWLVISTNPQYQLFSTGTWQPSLRISRDGTFERPGEMSFTPDGRTLAVVPSWQSVRLIDIPSGRALADFESPDVYQRITSVQFSPDGSLLFAGSLARHINVWDLRLIRGRLAEMHLDWR